MRVGGRGRDDGVALRRAVGADVGGGVDVEAGEVEAAADDLHVRGGELRRVGAEALQVGVGVAALLNDGHEHGVLFAHGAGGGSMCSGVSMTGCAAVTFSARPTLVPGFALARMACTPSP